MSDYNTENNAIVWVDVPVKDLQRALKFYGEVLSAETSIQELNGETFGVFMYANQNGGALVIEPEKINPDAGMLLYFGCHGRLHEAIAAVSANGGKVLTEINNIGVHGNIVTVLDSEGNKIALHSCSL
ncbi:VOC family protein [Paraferrimonas sp. SM1919]|uniref:VOC family protein n=1 Tax=Paraferrimonas sp. SM1919 TaxID=2662263 RepID=UPI0013D05D1B|nr:VOC family protein [Paraferrimonas sp. SM1919]